MTSATIPVRRLRPSSELSRTLHPSHSKARHASLLALGTTPALAVALHNVAGLALGYAVGRVCGMPISSRRAISIEVGMQNSGLAAALATVHFSPAAALPAAIFSVWHNVSGSILASHWSRRPIEAADAPDALSARSS